MSNKLKSMGYLFWLTVLAAIVLGGLTIYQAYDKVQSDKDAIQERKTAEQERSRADQARQEIKIAQDKSEKYLSELKEANSKIENLNQQSLIKSDEIIQKNEEVIKVQTETIRSITGFGLPIAIAGRSKEKDGHFYIFNKGDYNLKNLSVTIYDFTDGLKTHLKNNVISASLMDNHILATSYMVTLAPYQNLSIPQIFDFSQFKACEIRMYTDHGEFREFFVCQFDEASGLISHYYYKLYEINRLNSKWKLMEQKPNDNSRDSIFEKYFIMENYMMSVQ